jgi:hypothetical protein
LAGPVHLKLPAALAKKEGKQICLHVVNGALYTSTDVFDSLSSGVIVQIYACVLRRRRTHAELAIEYGIPYRPGPYYVSMCITVQINKEGKKKARAPLSSCAPDHTLEAC